MVNSSARAALDVGSVVADTYTIEALLGRGGMGSVFLASHNRLPGKKVAIKLLHVELTDDDVIARFRREAMIASQLDHPNIVRVDDYNVTADGTPYLVLEYLQGQSLAQRIAHGPMAHDHVTSIIRQVGSAVAAAHHGGIIHRDLKPQNIFLVPTELEGRSVEIAKVLDFGISKIRGSQTIQTQESSLLGTPQYMAPEQATGQHTAVDERTDIFALGTIVYEMLCGHPAFTGQSIPEVVFKVVYEQPLPLEQQAPTVSAAVARAVAQAMAKPADERFPSVSMFIEALTGQGLAPVRASLTGMPEVTSPVRSTGKDAFAHTVDSGDHAASLAAAAASSRTGGAAAPPASPHARTVESLAPASRPGSVAPVPAPEVPPGAAPAPRRRVALIAALVLVGIAAAAVAIYVASRGDSPERPTVVLADAATALVATAEGVVDAAVVEAVVIAPADAAIVGEPADAAIAGEPADAAVARPSPDARRTVPTTAPRGDPALTATVLKAEEAYRAATRDLAYRLANDVINHGKADTLQLSRAHAIRGAVECVERNSLERARADLRNIRQPRFRRFLINACRQAGVIVRER